MAQQSFPYSGVPGGQYGKPSSTVTSNQNVEDNPEPENHVSKEALIFCSVKKKIVGVNVKESKENLSLERGEVKSMTDVPSMYNLPEEEVTTLHTLCIMEPKKLG